MILMAHCDLGQTWAAHTAPEVWSRLRRVFRFEDGFTSPKNSLPEVSYYQGYIFSALQDPSDDVFGRFFGDGFASLLPFLRPTLQENQASQVVRHPFHTSWDAWHPKTWPRLPPVSPYLTSMGPPFSKKARNPCLFLKTSPNTCSRLPGMAWEG